MKSIILPELPIVGKLKLTTEDSQSLRKIDVVTGKSERPRDPFFQDCFEQLEAFLSGCSKSFDIPLDFGDCSPFQKDVLKVMKRVPYGKTATYKDLAVKLDSRAFQAIGSACGRNPFMLIYPCHRILGTNNMGGFAHGLKMKQGLLELEEKHA